MDIQSRLSERVKAIKESPTIAISTKAKQMKADGHNVIGFGAGEPDFDTPDHIKYAAIKALVSGNTKYTPADGMVELKDAIIHKFKRDNNLTYTRSNITVNVGAKHTLFNIYMALLNPGDEIIIPAPYWVSYPDMALICGATPVIVETEEADNFCMTPAQLEKAITPKTKAVVINSPSNPTGSGYSKDALKALADVIVKHDILCISDEIYEKLVYDGFESYSIASLGDEIRQRTIVVNGLSKEWAMTGWRIGYAAANETLIKAIANIQSQSTTNPTSFAQDGAIAALMGPQELIKPLVSAFDERRKYIVDRFNAIPGISCLRPQGAFYCFPNISALFGKTSKQGMLIKDSSDFAEYLISEALVAVVPGIAFGAEGFMRLSYAMGMPAIMEGLDRIEKAVRDLQ
ncbi:pyridoxal phosphate-dependent aminotransferase [Desulfurispirillum indicum]|uniref:Aminotransferase n=1 Tax=Desulfurispirillum indicum (strain ATCC BAA-1389 / DSM 22839 / S5) TaxID=653733 RepID=E6W1C4_DESIS|nr:pyridoxal phosphate-dependent aminotransferase [Desulfurispirillum indicum]ADU65380.1 aminotransferase class I and II [Desulfurispirillum indicum S5]UCZ57273.1 pyridoxal phosphate-dependent aminotransferase [Desulfurispirillum indicum]